METDSLVMRGSLREFDLPDVLQVVGVSRQHTLIELRDAAGKQHGAIVLKAGQVLAAATGTDRGRSAFFRLFRNTPDAFVVIRKKSGSSYPTPIGSLGELLLEACAATRGAESSLHPADSEQAVEENVINADFTRIDAPIAHEAIGSTEPTNQHARKGGGEPPPPPVTAHLSQRNARGSAPPKQPGPTGAPEAPEALTIAVTSPKGGVGKTTITLNLAMSLAERGIETVIVDADVNGDMLSLIDSRCRVERGVFELMGGQFQFAHASLRKTARPNLRILPSCGPKLSLAAMYRNDKPEAWQQLMRTMSKAGQVILIDCPAGMLHTTQHVLRCATHVVGVFQAEMIASRSFPMFLRGLELIPPAQRPTLAGVVVNMFQGRVDGSLESFQHICNDGTRHRIFDTTIPRADAFQTACQAGLPLRATNNAHARSIAWLFDMLAEEVCDRLGVETTQQDEISDFLM